MKDFHDYTSLIALAHLPQWTHSRINQLLMRLHSTSGLALNEFFHLSSAQWVSEFSLTPKEVEDLKSVRNDMPRLTFIAEQLYNEGFQLIPVFSDDYPKKLLDNLGLKYTPPLLYIKGKKDIFTHDSIAIVGSRNAGPQALEFTQRVAQRFAEAGKVVVSGYARGVDQEALIAALEAGGKSIIVLPQGILTFGSGFKKFYQAIVNGNLLVLSTFFPKASWDVGLAMARNAYIYGLANEIYVAESDFKGGTWQGVMDGLKRNRTIFVRVPMPNEKNANRRLIELGARPVEFEDNVFEIPVCEVKDNSEQGSAFEPSETYLPQRDIEKEITQLLAQGEYTAAQINAQLSLGWNIKKLTRYLKTNVNIETLPGRPPKFTLKEVLIRSLFD